MHFQQVDPPLSKAEWLCPRYWAIRSAKSR